MATTTSIERVVSVDVVSRETGGSGRVEFHNKAFYRLSDGLGSLGDQTQAFADAHRQLYLGMLTTDYTLDRIVISTFAEDSDEAKQTTWVFPYGQIGESVFVNAATDTSLPANMVAVCKFGSDGGRGASKYFRGMLRSTDVVFTGGNVRITNNNRDRFNNFAQSLVSHNTWTLVTVRETANAYFVADALSGAFSKIGFRQLDRRSNTKISTRGSSLRNRARRALREGQLIGASYNVLQALGEMDDAAATATIINNMEPNLQTGAPQLPGG